MTGDIKDIVKDGACMTGEPVLYWNRSSGYIGKTSADSEVRSWGIEAQYISTAATLG